MKTKLELGKSVNASLYRSLNNSIYTSVSYSLSNLLWFSLWDSVRNLVRIPINNLTIWEIKL